MGEPNLYSLPQYRDLSDAISIIGDARSRVRMFKGNCLLTDEWRILLHAAFHLSKQIDALSSQYKARTATAN